MPGNSKGEFNTGGSAGAHLYSNGEGYKTEMSRTADSLSEEAKLRRRLFAAHYIKTTNASSSADFAGFRSPGTKGAKLLKEPYVQHLIQELLDELDHDAIMTQNEILFQLKMEAMNMEAANQGARISALAHIAKIRGMMIDKQETKVTTDGGIMVVPAVSSPDEWSAMAEKAQATLKETVKD